MDIKYAVNYLINKIKGLATVSEETIIGSTDGSSIALRKCGKVVEFYGNYRASDGTLDSWQFKTITTLPTQWRPKYGMIYPTVSDRSDSFQTSLNIDLNGEVVISPRSGKISDTSDQITFTGHYFLP